MINTYIRIDTYAYGFPHPIVPILGHGHMVSDPSWWNGSLLIWKEEWTTNDPNEHWTNHMTACSLVSLIQYLLYGFLLFAISVDKLHFLSLIFRWPIDVAYSHIQKRYTQQKQRRCWLKMAGNDSFWDGKYCCDNGHLSFECFLMARISPK